MLRMRRNLLHGFVPAGRFLGGRQFALVFAACLLQGERLVPIRKANPPVSKGASWNTFGQRFALLTLLEATG